MAKSNDLALPLLSMAGILAIVYYLYTNNEVGTFEYENFYARRQGPKNRWR